MAPKRKQVVKTTSLKGKRKKEDKTLVTVDNTKTVGGGPKENEGDDDTTEDDEEQPTQSWRRKNEKNRMMLQTDSTDDTTKMYPREHEGSVSSIQESVDINSDEKMKSLEGRIKNMEAVFQRKQNEGELSVVSGSSVLPPSNDKLTVENLRTFVAAKVFPSWKFIFKKELLVNCVASAISKHFITVPPGYDHSQLAERYCTTV